jgi:hypothetical protein
LEALVGPPRRLMLDPQQTQAARYINRLLLVKFMRQRYEQRILQLLKESLDLDCLLGRINVPLLFQRIRDHRVRAGLFLTELVYLLEPRLGSLTLETKKLLVLGACHARIRKSGVLQSFVLRIFCSCDVEATHVLKHELQGSIANVARLFHCHMTTPSIKEALLRYIHAQSKAYMAAFPEKRCLHCWCCARLPTYGVPASRLHVAPFCFAGLSDIDDTFIHSGLGLGGPKFPKGLVMPGCLELHKALGSALSFITARPGFLETFTARSFYSRYKLKVGVMGGFLSDSVLIPFNMGYCNKLIAHTKYNNFLNFASIFPECSFLWMGDSGQADIEAGLDMVRKSDELRLAFLAGYIQDVALADGVGLKTPAAKREALAAERIHVVDNYVEAALDLQAKGLIGMDGLATVASAAATELQEARARFEDDRIWESRRTEFNRQFERVNALLEAHGQEAKAIALLT